MKPWATRATRSERSAYESDPAEVWIAMACGDLAAASSSMAANVMGDPVSRAKTILVPESAMVLRAM
jgi:hypothetical protein